MKTLRGPALTLGQFAGDEPPYNALGTIARWAADLGYTGIQIPAWDERFIDLKAAAGSDAYCDELKGTLAEAGVELTELATHLQGQLVAVHPAYDVWMDTLCPPALRGNPKARQEWAVEQVTLAARASQRLGLQSHLSFSGSLAWPFVYPFPQRPAELIEEAFAELARRWLPILDAHQEAGIDLCFELHPMEDLFDGITFEMFLERVGNHPRCNINYDASHFIKQGMDYLEFIDIYHERIKAFHVKDAEFNPTGRQGFLSGYQPWLWRAARDRSLGDGQVDFGGIFSRFAMYDFDGWAVYEWEDSIKHPEVAAREGAAFIRNHIIQVTDKVFDDFAQSDLDRSALRGMLGLEE